MGEWFLNLSIPWMAFVVFAATYVVAACVYLVVVRVAVDDRRARAFKAFSPGMLPPLGIIFGLLVGFVAVQVWNDFDKAKLAVRRLLAKGEPPFGARGQSTNNLHRHSQALEVLHLAMKSPGLEQTSISISGEQIVIASAHS